MSIARPTPRTSIAPLLTMGPRRKGRVARVTRRGRCADGGNAGQAITGDICGGIWRLGGCQAGPMRDRRTDLAGLRRVKISMGAPLVGNIGLHSFRHPYCQAFAYIA